ncbi:MAG: hypothetical protein Q4G68_12210 [Planctomycetia bacterium]|nr:hypothetical protein [Planctomycetia bacterium]
MNWKTVALITTLLVFTVESVFAGMPSIVLNHEPARHLISLSTALFLILVVSGFLVYVSWNRAFADTNIPRLTWGRSVSLCVVGGFLFLLVLVMIAGSRELLTPGAWQPQGRLYKLSHGETSHDARPSYDPATYLPSNELPESLVAARHASLSRLRKLLLQYREEHNGQWPATEEDAGFEESVWLVPGAGGYAYIYTPDHEEILVQEPRLNSDSSWFSLDRQGRIIESLPKAALPSSGQVSGQENGS